MLFDESLKDVYCIESKVDYYCYLDFYDFVLCFVVGIDCCCGIRKDGDFLMCLLFGEGEVFGLLFD